MKKRIILLCILVYSAPNAVPFLCNTAKTPCSFCVLAQENQGGEMTAASAAENQAHASDWSHVLFWAIVAGGVFAVLWWCVFFWNRKLSDEIDERKRAEKTLRESESRYRVIFEKSPLGMLRFDAEGTIRDCNEKFIQFMGSSREKLIGFNTAKQSTPKMRETIRKALAGQTAEYEDEYTSITGGKTMYLRVAFNPVNPGQSPTPVIATLEDIGERVRAEQALKESEERLRHILESTADIVIMQDADGRYLYYNGPAAYGLSAETVVGKTPHDFFDEDTASKIMADVHQVIRTGEKLETEKSVRWEGETLWFRDEIYPVFDAEGKVVATSQLSRNVTERRRAEKKLAESENKFSAAFMSSPAILIISTVEEGRYVEVNNAFTAFTGYSREETLGKTSTALALWDAPGQRAELFRLFERDGCIKNAEIKIKTKTGETRTGLLSTQKIILDEEAFFLSQIFDITEQRAAEKQLRESEERYRRLTENAHDIIWRTDRRGKLSFVNPAVRNLLGYAPADIIGFELSNYMTKDAIDRILKETKRIQSDKHGDDHFKLEVSYIAKNGETPPFEINAVALRDADGRIEGYEGVSRDIADRKKLEEELCTARDAAEAASRAKSEFIANMSHELRTPLNAVIGYGQLLLKDDALSVRNKEIVDVMKSSGEHLLILINDLLDIAKIEAGKLEIESGDMDLPALLSSVVDILSIRAAEKGFEIVKDFHADLPRAVRGDEKRLRQVLLNLLSNAVKFTEEGSVTLSARPVNGRIAFSVSDTGQGVPPEKHAVIFEAFQQEGAVRNKREGTGLGLAISRNLVRLMGGDIVLESAPGKGSVFSFHISLPAVSRPVNDDPMITIKRNDAAGEPADVARFTPPPANDLDILYEMSCIGDITGIRDHAESIRTSHPATREFCNLIISLTKRFEMRAIKDLIARFREETHD